jgi:phosphonate transport system substrate-binding protein
MNMQKTLTVLLTTVTLILIGCRPQAASTSTPAPTAPPPTAAATESSVRTIVLGDVSSKPAESIADFQPLADYIAANLSDQGITLGEVKVASTLEEMAEMMKSGAVDLYFDSAYPAMIVSNLSGAQPILRRWKGGVGEYHTVIFTSADSGIDALADLSGHTIAFDDVASTSGYMLPLAYLVEANMEAVEVTDTEAEVADDKIAYVFSDDDDNTVQWVLSGKVDAGALDSETFAEIPEENRAEMTILVETESLPRQLTLLRPGVDDATRDAIAALLMGLDKTDEGLAVLDSFEHTTKFDAFPEGPEVALNRMQELYDLVQGVSENG